MATERDGPAAIHGAGNPPAPPDHPVPDPSMEDILASIRRILNEEDQKPVEDVGAGPSHGHEPMNDDVLELDQAMLLPEPEPPSSSVGPVPEPPPIRAASPAPAPLPQPAAVYQTEAPSQPTSLPQSAAPSPLVAPEAAAAAAVSVAALLRTLASERSTAVHRGGPTIEDLVREEIRPLLKNWLDMHLPPMVERLVRAEIERVVSRMT